MRNFMNIVNEIEMADEFNDKWDEEKAKPQTFVPDQLDLFPKIPKTFTEYGKMGKFTVAVKLVDNKYIFFLFDGVEKVGYVSLKKLLDFDKGYKICGTRIDPNYANQGLGLNLYKWLLNNFCKVLVADDHHTDAGQNLWKRMVKDPALRVSARNAKTDKVTVLKTMRPFDRIYDYDVRYILFVELN